MSANNKAYGDQSGQLIGSPPYPPYPVSASDPNVLAYPPPAYQPYQQSYPNAPAPPYQSEPSVPPGANVSYVQYGQPAGYASGHPATGSYQPASSSDTVPLASGKRDVEGGFADSAGILSFDEKTVRLGFIRKVYALLALQMAVTVGLTCLFLFHTPTKSFVQRSYPLYITAYVIFFALYFVLVCCTKVARKHPINLILLTVFTLSLAYMVAVISSFHNTMIVLILFAITLLISACIMLFACQTKYDFTTWGGVLFVACLTLFFFGLFAGIMVPLQLMKVAQVVYASLGALLFMAFLAFDTQLILGGRKYEISPDDYVFASMMLYVDVIYIFLFLLQIFGGSK